MEVPARPASDSPFADPRARHSAGRFGMLLFLLSLAVLFLASVISMVVVRVQLMRDGLWPEDLPPLPKALWLSTVAMLLSDLTMVRAHRAAERGNGEALTRGLILTVALGAAFLVIQAFCWISWEAVVSSRWGESGEWRLALVGFYLLSGLHGLHVIGGLVALIVSVRHAASGLYSAEHHAGVQRCAWYWHFLAGVWIVLFILLLVGS
jgi:cytochrome c oxidase subunit 3